VSEERREIATTPSWSQRSPDREGLEDDLVRRFVEASRRAEIIAEVNLAGSPQELGELVCTELCEAFEAEKSFVLAARRDGSPPALLASTGLSERERARLLHDPLSVGSLGESEARGRTGRDLAGLGAQSLALAPGGGEGDRVLVGVARLYDLAFDAAELALMEAVTKGAAHALQRFWLAVDRERHATHQGALARAAKALGQSLDPTRVLNTLCAEVSHATGGEIVAVYFGDGAAGLHSVAAHGVPDDFVGLRRAVGEGLCGRVIASGVPQISNDYVGDSLAPATTTALHDVRSAMSAPLRRRGGLDGAVSVGFLDGRWVTDADVELLVAFAELANVACRNADEHAAAQLAASRDALTGCMNHATFQAQLRAEVARAGRGAEPFTLVMLDLVDFKSVNERFGHLSGDAVLRSVGEALRSTVREQDVVARFGGDEFALMLPDTAEEDAEPLVGRLLGRLRQVDVPGDVTLGAHAGLAEWRPGEGPTTLIERADQALLRVKRGRRDPAERSERASERERDPAAAELHERRAKARRRRLAVASRVGSKLSRLLDVQEVVDAAASELTGSLRYELVAILRLTGEGLVSPAARSSRLQPHMAAWSWAEPQRDGAIGRCLRERRPVLVSDTSSDLAVPSWPELGMRSELAVPLHVGTELWGAIDLLSPEPGAFEEHDARLVELVAEHAGTALRTAELYRKLEQTHLGVAEALAAALEAKDGYTAAHARWIAALAVEVARELRLPEPELESVRFGAIFHDIGKIAVPDAILNKPEPLTDEEWAVIRRHPLVGEQILAPVPFLNDVRRIVRHDHERWDGTGYPDGLRGTQIPIGARVVFAVDAYHAMVSDRPYRRAMSADRARAELQAHAGSQFDPAVVDALMQVLDRGATQAPR
jgi:diguanylate cyclase (GGDEF)-like protein/putative nucleotidyltransferase with HDIG domain